MLHAPHVLPMTAKSKSNRSAQVRKSTQSQCDYTATSAYSWVSRAPRIVQRPNTKKKNERSSLFLSSWQQIVDNATTSDNKRNLFRADDDEQQQRLISLSHHGHDHSSYNNNNNNRGQTKASLTAGSVLSCCLCSAHFFSGGSRQRPPPQPPRAHPNLQRRQQAKADGDTLQFRISQPRQEVSWKIPATRGDRFFSPLCFTQNFYRDDEDNQS